MGGGARHAVVASSESSPSRADVRLRRNLCGHLELVGAIQVGCEAPSCLSYLPWNPNPAIFPGAVPMASSCP
jgi:hypothetical protein